MYVVSCVMQKLEVLTQMCIGDLLNKHCISLLVRGVLTDLNSGRIAGASWITQRARRSTKNPRQTSTELTALLPLIPILLCLFLRCDAQSRSWSLCHNIAAKPRGIVDSCAHDDCALPPGVYLPLGSTQQSINRPGSSIRRVCGLRNRPQHDPPPGREPLEAHRCRKRPTFRSTMKWVKTRIKTQFRDIPRVPGARSRVTVFRQEWFSSFSFKQRITPWIDAPTSAAPSQTALVWELPHTDRGRIANFP